MKGLISVSLVLVTWALSATAVDAKTEDKRDYKCYLNTTIGEQIGFYRWPVKQRNLLMAKLVGSQAFSNSKPTPYIKEVIECVGLDDEFSTAPAQALDKQTVR
ncbi:TapY2 family type IVa secretion system protein [Shewanella sp. GXUN23E]|uniref:TapY2 family type IVa secretion system protein n=1 Tax=Shewanella sp. GXUN23E TaxID=3422498 RepID=UPI003D7EFD43